MELYGTGSNRSDLFNIYNLNKKSIIKLLRPHFPHRPAVPSVPPTPPRPPVIPSSGPPRTRRAPRGVGVPPPLPDPHLCAFPDALGKFF